MKIQFETKLVESRKVACLIAGAIAQCHRLNFPQESRNLIVPDPLWDNAQNGYVIYEEEKQIGIVKVI